MNNEGLQTILDKIAEVSQSNQWSTPNIVTIVIAAAAALASIVLCIVTILSSRRDTKSLRGEIFSKIINDHRNLFSTIYSNDKFYSVYEKLTSTGSREESTVGTFFINHANNLFYYYDASLIDKGIWASLEIDIVDIFNRMPFVEKRWEERKDSYPTKFSIYIENVKKAYDHFTKLLKDNPNLTKAELEVLVKNGKNELNKESLRIFDNYINYYYKTHTTQDNVNEAKPDEVKKEPN